MKIRKIILTKNGPRIDINVSGNNIFISGKESVSDSGMLITKNYIGDKYFGKKALRTIKKARKEKGFSLTDDYFIDSCGSISNRKAPDYEDLYKKRVSGRVLGSIGDFKVTITSSPYVIKLISIPSQKRIIAINNVYGKMLETPFFSSTADNSMVVVSHEEEIVAIIMNLEAEEEIKHFKNTFFF